MANYLYNGVDLPKVPDGYVHYYIYHPPNGNYYVMCANDELCAKYNSLSKSYFIRPKESSSNAICVLNGEEWTLDAENESRLAKDAVWTNHDIYYVDGDSDGTLYLAASEPVSVNPSFPKVSPHLAFTIGKQLGRRIFR